MARRAGKETERPTTCRPGCPGTAVAVGLQRPARVAKRILVVDDMPYLRDVQALLLRDAGYATTALGSASEALARLPDLAPDPILLDVSMPGMDGRQFLARLRATPEWQRLPVILTTGRSVEDMARENRCDILPKPFSEAALLDLVERLIGTASNGDS